MEEKVGNVISVFIIVTEMRPMAEMNIFFLACDISISVTQ